MSRPLNCFMKKGVLNIFTDASICDRDGIRYGCPGYVCVTLDDNGNEIIVDKGYTILENTTHNESEIYGILMGVRKANELRNSFETINLFSDSRISILTLNRWIFTWYYLKRKNDLLFNSSGVQVANQGVILEVIHTICNENLNINFYHQKGHVNIKSLYHVDNAKRVFKDSNNLFISVEEITSLSNYNNFIDSYTRENLLYNVDQLHNYDYLNINNNIIHFKSTFNLNKYKNLVNYQC